MAATGNQSPPVYRQQAPKRSTRQPVKPPKLAAPPLPLRHKGGQKGEGGHHGLGQQGDPEPGEAVAAEEVPQQAAEGDAAVENVLDQPVVPSEAEVLLGQLLCPAALHVLAGGEEFLLTAFQDLADALKQGDVRVGQARFP